MITYEELSRHPIADRPAILWAAFAELLPVQAEFYDDLATRVYESISEAADSVGDMAPLEFIDTLRKAAGRLETIGVGDRQPAAIFGIAAVCYAQARRGVTEGWHEIP